MKWQFAILVDTKQTCMLYQKKNMQKLYIQCAVTDFGNNLQNVFFCTSVQSIKHSSHGSYFNTKQLSVGGESLWVWWTYAPTQNSQLCGFPFRWMDFKYLNNGNGNGNPKIQILSFTQPIYVVPNYDFLHWIKIRTFLKNVGNQTVLVPNDFHFIFCPYNRSQWQWHF